MTQSHLSLCKDTQTLTFTPCLSPQTSAMEDSYLSWGTVFGCLPCTSNLSISYKNVTVMLMGMRSQFLTTWRLLSSGRRQTPQWSPWLLLARFTIEAWRSSSRQHARRQNWHLSVRVAVWILSLKHSFEESPTYAYSCYNILRSVKPGNEQKGLGLGIKEELERLWSSPDI